MKFYVASSFNHKSSVRYVIKQLSGEGFSLTYDWTQNERASTIEQLKKIGREEKNAVIEADIVCVLLPAGKGSHIELGMALAQGKKVYLYSPDEDVNNFETTSTFYHLPEVEIFIGSLEGFIELIYMQNS